MILSAKQQATLDKLQNDYVVSMETAAINYDRVEQFRLLVLEALNDWSGKVLGEGGNIKFTFGGNDPCCATQTECSALVEVMHEYPVVLYPVSGFMLSDKGELRFGHNQSAFRMATHTSGSRSDGIAIAESSHVRNVDAAMRIWVMCATEDCMAYLFEQMDTHNLMLEQEQCDDVRRIVTSAIQDRFSPGQVWNAMWRSVKDAAALSTRQYYNLAKAAKTIPKKIDNVLAQAAASAAAFEAYDRIGATPMGAVLTLLLNRFGISDITTGAQARAKFAADAVFAPTQEDEERFDDGRGIVFGSFFFMDRFTDLDRLILSCFKGIRLEKNEPEWDDERKGLGRIGYTMDSIYSFNGEEFTIAILDMLGVPFPTAEDVARHAALAEEERAKTTRFLDASGESQAIEEVLLNHGLSQQLALRIGWIYQYRADAQDIVWMVGRLPLCSGLVGIRMDNAHVYAEYAEQSHLLAVADYNLPFPEYYFEPIGNDQDVVMAAVENEQERLAELISAVVLRAVPVNNPVMRSIFLRKLADKMLAETTLSPGDEYAIQLPQEN